MDFDLDECTIKTPTGTFSQMRINSLSPTQNAVGFDEVNDKVSRFSTKSENALKDYLLVHSIPIVIGNGDRFYVIDHHHLVSALWKVAKGKNKAGLTPENTTVVVQVMRNWRHLQGFHFWQSMFKARWVHLFDPNGGGPISPDSLIEHVKGLKNDPYRSLSWYVRKRYGYAKSEEPFAEFLWAEFFRHRVLLDARILKGDVREEDFLIGDLPEDARTALIDKAWNYTRSPEAAGLPGFLGLR
jgi:hypothetical protein